MKFIQVSFSKLASAMLSGVLLGVLWGAKSAIELGPWTTIGRYGFNLVPPHPHPSIWSVLLLWRWRATEIRLRVCQVYFSRNMVDYIFLLLGHWAKIFLFYLFYFKRPYFCLKGLSSDKELFMQSKSLHNMYNIIMQAHSK